MNAQEEWKYYYRQGCFDLASDIRREAALERIIARLERTIEALQSQVWQLQAQEHNSDDGNEWEKEYYLRGMHR